MPNVRSLASAMLAAGLFCAAASPSLAAYCGCDKPPPAPNVPVRPDFSYPGATIVLFNEHFVPGKRYIVNFYRFRLLDGLALLQQRLDASTTAVAVSARDQGDFDPQHPTATLPQKKQLRVKLPAHLHYGPSRIEVVDAAHPAIPVHVISQDEFTVIGRPIPLTETMTDVDLPVATGMSHDGHVFFAFDMSHVRNQTLVDARMTELVLPLSATGVTGWNIQGFNVGTLAALPDDPKFGWRLLDAKGLDVSVTGNANRIRYWRHEFFSWEAAHEAGGAKMLVDDPIEHDYWHQDGTPHFDQDHIVVAVDVGALDPAQLLRGTRLNLIHLRITTTRTPNPYAADPNPANDGASTTSSTSTTTSSTAPLLTLTSVSTTTAPRPTTVTTSTAVLPTVTTLPLGLDPTKLLGH